MRVWYAIVLGLIHDQATSILGGTRNHSSGRASHQIGGPSSSRYAVRVMNHISLLDAV